MLTAGAAHTAAATRQVDDKVKSGCVAFTVLTTSACDGHPVHWRQPPGYTEGEVSHRSEPRACPLAADLHVGG